MTDEHENLARLSAAATDSDLTDGGRYFSDSCDDLTQCNHGDTGEYSNPADGKLLEALWNLYRSGRLVLLPSVEELARALARRDLHMGDTDAVIASRVNAYWHEYTGDAKWLHNHLKGTGDAD